MSSDRSFGPRSGLPLHSFDAGSSGFLVQENLVYQASGGHTRLKEEPEAYTFKDNAFLNDPEKEKAALPEVRAKAGLEDKWKTLQKPKQ